MSEARSSDVRSDHPRSLCVDCDVHTYINEQYYMLHDELWEQVTSPDDTMLCLNCFEVRLGRALNEADFATAPVNEQQASLCPELYERLHRKA